MDVQIALQIQGVRCSRDPRLVLKGLDLALARGEVVGLLGRNGAGKSTLIDVITGRVRPEAGHMSLDGAEFRPSSPEAARTAGVSVIEQDFRPPVELSVAQAVLRHVAAPEGGPSAPALAEQARPHLAALGLAIAPDVSVSSLDAAEQALVEVARVLAEEPRVVIVDEASAALDDREIAHCTKGFGSCEAGDAPSFMWRIASTRYWRSRTGWLCCGMARSRRACRDRCGRDHELCRDRCAASAGLGAALPPRCRERMNG